MSVANGRGYAFIHAVKLLLPEAYPGATRPTVACVDTAEMRLLQRGGDVVSSDETDIKEWHRKFAVDLFNHTWDLIESEHRSEDDDLEMLSSAIASLHHWRQVGEAKNLSVSDWQVSRVFALLDHPNAARRFGRRSLRLAEEHSLGPFYEGYGHEALARAAAVAGDEAERDVHLAKARRLATQVDKAGEAEILVKDLEDIARG